MIEDNLSQESLDVAVQMTALDVDHDVEEFGGEGDVDRIAWKKLRPLITGMESENL